MTAYNREKYIVEAIESVLASTYTNFELIIVDDCSTDRTVEIAKSYEAKDSRIKVYVNEKNLGDYPNRNRAASYARGKYLKYLDSDDAIYPHGLEMMVKSMEQFPEAGFGLASKPEDDRKYPVCISSKQIYLEHFSGYGHFDRSPGSAIIKREAFESVGGFTGERMIGDLQLWLTLAKRYAMVKYPFDLYWNRLHEGQEFQTDYAKMIYPLRVEEILLKALNDNNCPLNHDEKQKIFSTMKKKKRRKKIMNLTRKLAAALGF